jgi:MFS family permease
MLSDWPAGRRLAMTALFCFCSAILVVTVLGGLSPNYPVRMMQVIACALAAIVVLAGIIATITGRLAHYTSPADEEEFEQLVRHSRPSPKRPSSSSWTRATRRTSRSSCARRSTTCRICC